MPIEKVTVSRDDGVYELLPDVARMPSGKLVCIYRESDGHTVRHFSIVATRTSVDDGHTWSPRRPSSRRVRTRMAWSSSGTCPTSRG